MTAMKAARLKMDWLLIIGSVRNVDSSFQKRIKI